MKITIEKQVLLPVLKKLQKNKISRDNDPITNDHFLIECRKGVSVYKLVDEKQTWLGASIKCIEAPSDGRALLPVSILKALPTFGDKVTFEWNRNCVFVSDVNTTVPYLTDFTPDRFPKLPDLEFHESANGSTSLFTDFIPMRPFIGDDELRLPMTGVNFKENKDGILEICSTDAHGIARVKVPHIQFKGLTSFILPGHAVNVLIGCADKFTNPLTFGVNIKKKKDADGKEVLDKVNAIFKWGQFILVSKTILEKFPEYERILERQITTRVLADSSEMVKAIKTMKAQDITGVEPIFTFKVADQQVFLVNQLMQKSIQLTKANVLKHVDTEITSNQMRGDSYDGNNPSFRMHLEDCFLPFFGGVEVTHSGYCKMLSVEQGRMFFGAMPIAKYKDDQLGKELMDLLKKHRQ